MIMKKRFNLRKDKAVQEQLVPRFNNKLNSYEAFRQKVVYDETSYPELLPNPIDTHSDYNILYGRINENSSPVVLSEVNLKQVISPDGKTKLLLNFVADAWNDLVQHHQKAIALNAIRSDKSVFKKLQPAKTWESAHVKFNTYVQDMYGTFTGVYLDSEINQKIVDFNSFMKIYLDFCRDVGLRGLPLTRTGFITTRYNSPLTSGLTIELVEGKHDDDYAKYIGFIRDANFDYFTNACEKYGFMVDKNAPWRIMADFNSAYMKDKMLEYGVEEGQFFKSYYHEAIDFELENIKRTFYQLYQLFLSQQPDVTNLSVKNKNFDTKTSICYTQRSGISLEEVNEKYGDGYWLKVLIYLRAIETDYPHDQNSFDKSVRDALQYYHWLGLGKALEYIKKKYSHNTKELYKTELNKNLLTNVKDYGTLFARRPSFKI